MKTRRYQTMNKTKNRLKYLVITGLILSVSPVFAQNKQVGNEKVYFATEDTKQPVTQEFEAPEATIRRLAEETGFKWPDYLIRLAKCESQFDPKATNTQNNFPKTSKDRGIFQISDYWHSEVTDEQAYDVEWATHWTMDRISQGYQHEWACDRIINKK